MRGPSVAVFANFTRALARARAPHLAQVVWRLKGALLWAVDVVLGTESVYADDKCTSTTHRGSLSQPEQVKLGPKSATPKRSTV